MKNLFWYMMKEEWRIHSTMFGSLSFALFPVFIFGMAFMGSFLLPLIRSSLPPGNVTLLLHTNYLLLGFMVGAFGLLGNEAMNRRFGQASLLAYAVRTLPLSDRYIFLTFVLKDTCYYFILWVLPFALGFLTASPVIGIPVIVPVLLMFTLSLSFLTGLTLVFFLSTLYGRSKPVLGMILGVITIGSAGYVQITGNNPALLFPPVMLLQNFTWMNLGISLLMIFILFVASLIIFVPEHAAGSNRYKNQMIMYTRLFSRFPYPAFTVKDIIDLIRSGSAVGQTIFSFFIPLIVIWFFLSLTSGYLPKTNLLFLFSVTTGVIASTMYTWLTAFDSYSTYSCLPVSIRTVITGKISSFTILQAIPVIFLVCICLLSEQAPLIIPAVVLCLSTSYFVLGVTIWLSGLSPQIMMYDIRVMARYFLLIGISSSICCSVAFYHPWLSLTSITLFLPAWLMIQRGCEKWELQEQPVF